MNSRIILSVVFRSHPSVYTNIMCENMKEKDAELSVTISEFYKGRNVFITGATGFLGKMLIYKLLQGCADIGNIYILIRPKKGMDLQERVEKITKDQLFDGIRQNAKHQLSKIIPLRGDCVQLKLGLSDTDYQTITSSVSVIYHVAASVRFDDSLKYAILLNTRGTREVAQLALQTPGLSIFVHCSTTYCNCVHGFEIDEQLYPAPDDWRNAIQIAEEFNNDQLAVLSRKYIGQYPNTYTFTKALGEHVVKDLCEGKIPTIICRPSIVLTSAKDPVTGWIDNFNGPMGLLVACGKGLLRKGYYNLSIYPDFVPVDTVVKSMIVASWYCGLKQETKKIDVINCSCGDYKWLSIEGIIYKGRDFSHEIPFNNAIWVPKGYLTGCKFYAYFCIILFHLVPAFFLDLGLKFAGKKPMLSKLHSKIYNAGLQIRYFTWNQWEFHNNKFWELHKKILETDRNTWEYDFRGINVEEYIKACMLGSRRYLLNEPDETLPKARIHYKRMYWLDKFTMFILYGSLVWLILHFQVLEKTADRMFSIVSYYLD